jgi:hypothetical protein
MFHHKVSLLYLAAALALLVALASNAIALADDYRCTGSLGAIRADNLRVPQNSVCILNGTRVSGNILVETNATLHAYNVRVDNNIQADNAARVNVYSGTSVGGSIQIFDSGAADIRGVNLEGDLQAFNNNGEVAINTNTIDGNLQCKGNSPPPTGGGNIVQGSMEDQCANFGGDPSPAPTITPTVAASTPSAPTSTPTVAAGTPSAPTSTPTVPTKDLEAPTVRWIAPVPAGGRFDLHEGEQVFLEVEVNDNVSVGQVRFLWWDAANEQYVTLGTLVQPPFRLQVSASTLNPDWNQIFAVASDLARNNSDSPYVWLYKLVEGGAGYQIYLPFTGK